MKFENCRMLLPGRKVGFGDLLIENGKITAPVKNAMLIGSGTEVMNAIDMIGNDSCLDNGIGACGKGGQSVPVGVGQPSVRIKNITVGGSENA